MSNLTLSRRDFLKTSAVLGASFVVFTQAPVETFLREIGPEEAAQLKAEAGEVKVVFTGLGLCGCGRSGMPSMIFVKNGRIIRITSARYDLRYRPEEFNYDAWTIEARGKTFKPSLKAMNCPFATAARKRIYSPNRIRYPLKRVDFDPNAPPNKRNQANRGKSGFVRISWDEALDIIVKEIKRIKETYGTSAILTAGVVHGYSKTISAHYKVADFLMKCIGQWTEEIRNPDSWEGWYWGAKHVWGEQFLGYSLTNNAFLDTLQNCDLVIYWAGDPETTAWMNVGGEGATDFHLWLREAGIKIISICPDQNWTAAIHADKWIPVLPNTDAALMLAIAYVWITEGTYEKQYVYTHGHGFDEFKKYVLGEADGVPKTPKWAEQICGVPARVIKALAREWASKRTSVAHSLGGPMIRGPYSTEAARLEALLLAMQGLGKPGVRVTKGGKPSTVFVPPPFIPFVEPPLPLGAPQMVPRTLTATAILKAPIVWYGSAAFGAPASDQFKKYEFPVDGYSEIHMIWDLDGCHITCYNGEEIIDAFRSPKIEFILGQQPWLETDMLFADIVLPVCTVFELEDVNTGGGNFTVIYYMPKVIEPLWESKSDYDIVCTIAEKLGPAIGMPDLLEKYTGGMNLEQRLREVFEVFYKASPYISWEEFKQKQYWVCPINPDWKNEPPAWEWYWKLPEGSGLTTPTGKIEFYSTAIAENFPNDMERPPVPHYIPYGETWQESKLHPKAKQYSLLLVSNHPRWRVHAHGDDISWINEIPTARIRGPDGYLYHPVWIHPIDAARRGIKHGDIVKVYNERGAVLGAAYVTERMIPGAVSMDHGARLDPISIDERIDRGGNINLLMPRKPWNPYRKGYDPFMCVSGYLVEVEKVDLNELKQKYPDAFNRPYDPAAGLVIDGWIKG
ncbi:MAG: molybdopterin-dependent oxidoreductase [Conexivisphaerales archaeon]